MTKIYDMMFIKHKQYRDTCFYVMKVFDVPGNKYKIKAERWNLGHDAGFDMGIKESFVIEYQDLINWQWTTLDTINLRHTVWNEFV